MKFFNPMAKDPAMLWYWSDWNSGTGLLSRFLKGCYMDLLHAQFNHGRLSLEEIKTCLGTDFGHAWPALQKKFKSDESGLFFNERLEIEKIKRVAYSESRRYSRNKSTYEGTYVPRTIPRTENRNRDINTVVSKNSNIDNTVNDINISFNDFWDMYDKKVGNQEKIKKKWVSLKDSDRQLAMEHIPKYKQAQPDKKFRKDPSSYLNNKSWLDEIIESNGSNIKPVNNNNGKLGTSDARMDAISRW